MWLKKNLVFTLIFIFSFSIISAQLPNLINGNSNLPSLDVASLSNNTYNVNYTIINNINEFDQSLNTTNNVQFQNLTPTLNDTYSLGSPEFVWKDLYLGDNSLHLGKSKISYSVADDDGIMLDGSIHLEALDGVSGNLALHEGTEPLTCVSNDGGRLWYNLNNDLMWQDKNSVSKRVLLEGDDGIWSFNGNDIYYNSGNVGIGTDSPNNKLNVYETTWDTANTPLVNITNLDPNANDGDVLLVRGGANNANSDIFEVQDYSGNTDFVILGNGNVGIGTDSPNAKLEVSGDIRVFESVGNPRILVGDNATSGQWGGFDWDSTSYYLQIMNSNYSASNGVINILSSGYVGIGTITPTHKLNVIGNVNITGNLTVDNISLEFG
ncbi:hypothetical protein LCGC14_2469520, partial [marine sediment metagenome]